MALNPGPFSRAASSTVAGLVNTIAQSFQGAKTFLALLVASAFIQTAAVFNTNGSGASDVGVINGVSTSDGTVNSGAKLASWGTGVGGTYVEYMFRKKGEFTFWGDFVTIVKWDAGGANHWEMRARPNFNWELGNNTVTYMGCRVSDGYCFTQYGFDVIPSSPGTSVIKLWGSSNQGRIDQYGTDSTGTPGSRTGANAINRPTGKSSVASGNTTCQIDNSHVTTGSRVMVTFHADPGGRYWVTLASGSFTVNLSASAGANLPFSWEVSSLL